MPDRKLIVAVVVLAAIVVIIAVASFTQNPIQNTTTITINATTTIPLGLNTITQVYAPSQELPLVSAVYPIANMTTFSCTTGADCVIVHAQGCFNNGPTQQACINKAYQNTYQMYYGRNQNSSGVYVCPQYYAQANVSCSCISGGCNMVYAQNR